MSQVKYLETNVGVYKKSEKGFYRHVAMTLWEVINHPSWDDQVLAYRKTKTKENPKGDRSLKNKIMAYMPSGDYGRDTARKVGNPLTSSTNLVQLDFDQPIPAKRLKDIFKKYPWIAVAQVSCGGGGFYFLVYTEHSKDYAGYFWALTDFFEKKEKLKVDVAVSSVNEIRFVSLTKELLWRDDATQWTEKIEQPESPMDKISIALDGDPVPLPEEIEVVHYVDLISWAGKNNANGVPLDKAIAAFPMDRIGKASHLYKKEKVVKEVITSIYQRYAEQHGEAVVTPQMLENSGELNLPAVTFHKNDTQEQDSQRIIDAIVNRYQFKSSIVDKKVYRYNGTHWVEIIVSDLRNFLSKAALAIGYNHSRARLPGFRDKMQEDLTDRTACEFDVPLNAFNLKNGILIFEGGEVKLIDHSDAYNFTYIRDYEYNPAVIESAIFKPFIDRVMPDQATQQMLFDYIGAGFIDDSIKIEKTLILLGSGANGKSTIVDLLSALFGDAVGRFNLERLTDQNESPKEARNIYNKVFGVCAEARTIKDFNIWKAIISKEKIDVKYLYRDTFQTNNYGRLITCMNEIPNIEAVKGSMRRLIIIGMNVEIPEHEQDAKLNHKLLADRTYIINLVVNGYRRVFATDGQFELSDESRDLTVQVIDDSDQVISFIRAKRYIPMPASNNKNNKLTRDQKLEQVKQSLKLKGTVLIIPPSKLYSQFTDWCKEEGNNYPLGRKKFLQRVRALNASRLGGGEGNFSTVDHGDFIVVEQFLDGVNEHATHDFNHKSDGRYHSSKEDFKASNDHSKGKKKGKDDIPF